MLDLEDNTLCRQFVGFVTYLRYFAPGTRAYFFPAIADWGDLDHWLKEGGLDLPPPRHSRRWPQLLVKSRPSGVHSAPDYEPELPVQLPFGRHDPDLAEGANTILPLASKLSSRVRVGVCAGRIESRWITRHRRYGWKRVARRHWSKPRP